ncbi:MAG: AAA family ATPase [Bacteroidetes bacterium]|nr:AAA family ATPase [Bacteroidota bacterium]
MELDITALNEKIKQESAFVELLTNEIGKVIVGQKAMVERLIVGLLSNGHVLLEGVPGLAKTLAIKTLSSAMKAKFQRIQFTPDLLPADLVGTQIYNQRDGNFLIRKGPIFSNFILADEINRAPAKVQSALLEAMQERQVTIGEQTFQLEEPFLVLATENPIEQEGTYPLPEAQIDRFMLKVNISYPARDEELKIMRQNVNMTDGSVQPVISPKDILKARELVHDIYIAKAMAFIKRRGYVIPEDIRAICPDILRHRIAVTYEAEAEEITSEDVIRDILNKVEVP